MGLRQFVTFRLDNRLLGIDILKVREINRSLDITPVQHAPAYVRGLVNLRGQTVTVFDLGVRLGLPPRKISGDSHNIILKQDEIGLIVDEIGDVREMDEERIEAPPANLNDIGAGFVECVAKLKSELLVILSAEKILEFTRNRGEHT
jgi:purine-binding chemotaxis protein CheW